MKAEIKFLPEISQLQVQIKELQQQFIAELPYDAWRFFTDTKTTIEFSEKYLAFGHGDFFGLDSQEFKNCLEFWVKQAGGEVTWKTQKDLT